MKFIYYFSVRPTARKIKPKPKRQIIISDIFITLMFSKVNKTTNIKKEKTINRRTLMKNTTIFILDL